MRELWRSLCLSTTVALYLLCQCLFFSRGWELTLAPILGVRVYGMERASSPVRMPLGVSADNVLETLPPSPSPNVATSETRRGLAALGALASQRPSGGGVIFTFPATSRVLNLPSIFYMHNLLQPLHIVILINCLVSTCVIAEPHWLGHCPVFDDLSIHQKWRVISYFSLCPICLFSSHRSAKDTCPACYPSSKDLCPCVRFSDHCQILCPAPPIMSPFSCSLNSDDCGCIFLCSRAWWSYIFPDCKDSYFHEPHSCVAFAVHSISEGLDITQANDLCSLCLKNWTHVIGL